MPPGGNAVVILDVFVREFDGASEILDVGMQYGAVSVSEDRRECWLVVRM